MNKRVSVRMCVCACVFEREREREKERDFGVLWVLIFQATFSGKRLKHKNKPVGVTHRGTIYSYLLLFSTLVRLVLKGTFSVCDASICEGCRTRIWADKAPKPETTPDRCWP